MKMCERQLKIKSYNDPKHLKIGFERLYEMLEQEQFCDVDVIIGSESFAVHKNVMAAFSDSFVYLTKNIEGLSRAEAIIQNVDSNTMRKVIEYCYTGKISLSEDTLEKMFSVAGILQMQSLLKLCADFLRCIIDVKNCIKVAKLAILYNNIDLEEFAKDFICFNFNEVSQIEEFNNIEYNMLLDLLKSDDLNVFSEETVFKSALRWTKYDYSNRIDQFCDLIEFIKLPLLPNELLLGEMEPPVREKCLSRILEAIQWKINPNRRPLMNSSRNVPRKSATVAIAIGDWFPGISKVVLIYDPETKSMSELMTLDTQTVNFCAVIVEDKIIIMAGIDNGQYIKNVESYDIKTGSKTLLPSMLQIRDHPVTAVMNGFIYAAGGYDGKIALNTMERYDPMSQTWTFVEPMSTPRYDAGGVVFNNELYVIGGYDGFNYLNVVESYCRVTDTWRLCAPLNVSRRWISVAVANGFIYTVGGCTDVHMKTVERYDPKTNTWSMIAEISIPRYAIGLCAIGKNLLAYGGSSGSTRTELEEYDADTDKWNSLTSTIKRGHFNFIAMPKRWIKRIKANSKKGV